MFREMLRKKQQISDAECIEILKQEKRGVLSVLGDDDYPYGMPLNHFYSQLPTTEVAGLWKRVRS